MPIAMIDGDVLGFIAVTYSLDEVHEQLEEIANSMAMTTGVAVVMAGILALLASWYFARPILAIRDAALAVSHGALHTRSAVKRRDEIGHLSAAINAMADGLVQRVSELELARLALSAAKDETEEANRQVNLLNQDLEWRVAARTAELREAQHSLMQRERLSALGQLTATVAHELRNPISVIQNTLFTMKAALAGRGMTLDKPIARMERSISRCNRIISDLLDYSRQRDLQYSERDLDEWLAAAVAEHPRSADLAIECDLGAGGIVARFDIERLRRVAINLIDNAAQALAEKPPVGTAPRIVVGTRATGDGVELFVRDNGPGIAPDVLPKIFEPLFSTKAFGTGLGLPTVKQIVEQHGGRIDVTSEAGIGTDVRIRLPIISQRTVAA